METVFRFVLDHSILNFFPLLLGLAVAVFGIGPWLIRRNTSIVVRTLVYATTAAIAGVWAYAAFDVKQREVTVLELAVLGIGMLLLVSAITFPFVYFSSKKRAAAATSAGA